MAFAISKSISWKVGLSILGAGSAMHLLSGSTELLPLVTNGTLGSIAVLTSMKFGAHLWNTFEIGNDIVSLQKAVAEGKFLVEDITLDYQLLVSRSQKHFDNAFDNVLMQGQTEHWSTLCDVGTSILKTLDIESSLYIDHAKILKQAQGSLLSSFTVDELDTALKARRMAP